MRTWRSQSWHFLGGGAERKGWSSSHLSNTRLISTSSVKLKLSERIFNHKRALKYITQFFFAVLGTNTI